MGKFAKVDQVRSQIRGVGLRATASRVAVLALLQHSEQPLSHADVVGRLGRRGWDPATLYRNLVDLTDAALLRRTDVGDHVWRFEIIRDEHEGAHPHFVCTECGTVECLPAMRLTPHARAPRALKRRQVEIQVRGLCDTCI